MLRKRQLMVASGLRLRIVRWDRSSGGSFGMRASAHPAEISKGRRTLRVVLPVETPDKRSFGDHVSIHGGKKLLPTGS